MKPEGETDALTKTKECKVNYIKRKFKKSSGVLIGKFKLKPKSPSLNSVPSETTTNVKATSSTTPEGDDHLLRSTPEIDLTGSSNKTAENICLDKKVKVVFTKIYEDNSEISENREKLVQIERTASVEDLRTTMPAYGDLILDSSMSNQNSAKPSKDHLYKILMIGDIGAGKTAIIKRYVHNFFSQHYRATVGVDFALKVIHWDSNTVIRLQLWDIAGQERFGNMTRIYYKEAVGAFIVFDLTRPNTFESVSNWKTDLDSKVQLPDGSSIPCVLLGNKCDQYNEAMVSNPTKMNDYCKEKGFVGWFETSAKENINLEEAANALIREILQNNMIINKEAQKDKDQFTLTSNQKTQNGRKCYKC